MTATRPTSDHPLVIVGAGPIGLAAAAHAVERGVPTVVVDAGPTPGAAVAAWGHVRLFSAWSELVDPAAARLLASHRWTAPDPTTYPTGGEWVERYLMPLAAALADAGVTLRLGHRVVGLARHGRDRLVALDRQTLPFVVHLDGPTGAERLLAGAVIDASGTYDSPQPLGGDGYPALGEVAHTDRIAYGIPDLEDPAVRARYAGRHVAVAGSGASAQNVLVALAGLAAEEPATRVTWLVRRPSVDGAFGGGDADELAERGALGRRAERAVTGGTTEVVTSFRTRAIEDDGHGRLRLRSFPEAHEPLDAPGRVIDGVDRIVAVTGFAPDHSWLRQVHLDLDGELDAPRRLAPEIHPAHHSCGSVSPHGADLLRQPEGGLYLAGMKSYGRAPSFLALTGFEQVRSIVAEIAGDHEAAARVELTLPDTGVCGGSGLFDGAPAAGGCCGTTPAPELLHIGTAPGA